MIKCRRLVAIAAMYLVLFHVHVTISYEQVRLVM